MIQEDTVEEYLLMWKQNQSMFLRETKQFTKKWDFKFAKKKKMKKIVNGIYTYKALLFFK